LPQSRANVYDILKRDKLAISSQAFLNLQQRVIDQYNHIGKRKAYNSRMDEIRAAQI